jgi:hypothetical protein
MNRWNVNGALAVTEVRDVRKANACRRLARMPQGVICSAIILLFTLAAHGEQGKISWNQFRGPNGRGVVPSDRIPVRFGPETNVLWTTAVPAGHSSPVIWGDHIFLTASEPAHAKELTTLAFNRESGRIFWRQVVQAGTQVGFHPLNNPASSTPATDGQHVYVYFVVLTSGLGSVTSQVAFVTAGHMVSPAPGWLQLDQYNAATLSDLLDPSSLGSTTPDRVRWVSSFEGPADLPDNSGERFFGWFIPPVTTNYVFFVCSDDASLLLLSTDATAARKCQIAEETGWSAARSWVSSGGNSILSQKRSDQFVYNGSFPGGVWPGGNTITLTAGVPYYIELAHFEGGGGQDASVTYTFAGAADPADGSATVLTSDKLSTMSAPDYLLPPPQPRMVTVAVSGSNATVSGTNGLVNAQYYLLSTTDVSLPLVSWTPARTNRFDARGYFTDTVPRNPAERSRFYRLSVP